MGGCTFVNQLVFGKDVEDAFRNAKEQARQMRGHQEGYSGDIQTKSSWKLIDAGKRDLKAVIDECLETGDISEKNGPAGAIILPNTDGNVKKFKECTGRKGKRGVVVLFFGWARC